MPHRQRPRRGSLQFYPRKRAARIYSKASIFNGTEEKPLAFAGSCNNPCYLPDDCTNRFYAYGVVARLALLAAARELKEVGEQPCP